MHHKGRYQASVCIILEPGDKHSCEDDSDGKLPIWELVVVLAKADGQEHWQVPERPKSPFGLKTPSGQLSG